MDMYEEEVDFANSNLSFPQKLFALLEYESDGMIQWAPNGLCFRLTDQDRFASEVVPKYFKRKNMTVFGIITAYLTFSVVVETKLTSFQRQLNLYGFRRLAKGEDQGCYFHPRFQRGRRDLLHEIKRLPVKGSLPSYDQLLSSTRPGPYQYDPNNSRKRSATDVSDPIEDGSVPRRKMTTRLSSQQQQLNHSDDTTEPATDVSHSSHGSHAPLPQAPLRNFHVPQQQFATSYSGNPAASVQHNNGGGQQLQRMSKLTMNIGFGKTSSTFQPTTESSKSGVVNNGSRGSASPTHGMGLRNNNRPLYRQSNHPQQSSASTTNNPYSNSSFYYQLPYSFPASALPMSSNFVSESRAYYSQLTNTMYGYNYDTQESALNYPQQQQVQRQLQQQQHQEYLKEQNSFSSFAGILNEGSERAPSLLGDDLDVLDLFSGDIPQSTHGTPIPSTPMTDALGGFDTSVLMLSGDGGTLAGESELM